MKHRKYFSIGLACLLPLIAMTQTLQAQMNYQGRLTDALGVAITDGQYAIEFRLFSASTGGTELWGPFNAANVDVVAGRFNTIIGATDAVSRPLTTALANANIYLQIKVGTNAPLAPRQQILAAPKALHATTATTATTANTAANFTSVVLKTDEVNGRVGIGTTTPAGRLEIQGGANADGSADLVSLALGYAGGGYRHFMSSRHDGAGATSGNAIDFYLNTSTTAAGSSKPGIGNTRVMTLSGNGRVGIGTNAPTNPLSVTGNADFTGNVGIGTAAPTNRLSVTGNANFTGKVGIGPATPSYPLSIMPSGSPSLGDLIDLGGWTYGTGGADHFGIGISGFGELQIHTPISGNDIVFGYGRSGQMAETVRFTGGGRVGIGTNTPRAPLEVGSSVASVLTKTFAYPANVSASSYSIIAQAKIYATGFEGTSDMRIKNIISLSDSVTDLKSLMEIGITDYTMRDVISHGSDRHKKVIAQELENVYPQAVKKSVGTVPDIYKKAPIKDGWVSLATDLKLGERVRLIGEKTEGIHEVLEIADGRFRTEFTSEGNEIFVYGREVNDFRTVDYDAIAMLNVSATQQIKKEKDAEVVALREENTALRARIAALETRDLERDAKIALIERSLKALDLSGTRLVSLKNEDMPR
jgi:hypothetical protein